MNLSKLLELIREFDAYDRTGMAGRPDDSGIRGKGVDRQPDRRLMNFPYDRDVSYGQPANYDRGNSGGSNLNHPLTPKDDSGFSLRILGIEDPAEIEEAGGAPSSPSKGNSSQLGTSVPGASMGWANDPPKTWDDPDVKDPWDSVEDIQQLRNESGPPDMGVVFDPRPPMISDPPNADQPDFRSETDDDLENKVNRIWGYEDNDNFVDPGQFGQPDAHMIAPDPWGVVNKRLSSRLYGMMPKESAWDRVSGMVLVKREIS